MKLVLSVHIYPTLIWLGREKKFMDSTYYKIFCSQNKITDRECRDVFIGNATGFVYARNK